MNNMGNLRELSRDLEEIKKFLLGERYTSIKKDPAFNFIVEYVKCFFTQDSIEQKMVMLFLDKKLRIVDELVHFVPDSYEASILPNVRKFVEKAADNKKAEYLVMIDDFTALNGAGDISVLSQISTYYDAVNMYITESFEVDISHSLVQMHVGIRNIPAISGSLYDYSSRWANGKIILSIHHSLRPVSFEVAESIDCSNDYYLTFLHKYEAMKQILNGDVVAMIYPFEEDEILDLSDNLIVESYLPYEPCLVFSDKHFLYKLPDKKIKSLDKLFAYIKKDPFFYLKHYYVSPTMIEWIEDGKIVRPTPLNANNWDDIKCSIMANQGVAIIPKSSISKKDIDKGMGFIDITHICPKMEYKIVCRKDMDAVIRGKISVLSERIRRFIGILSV